MKKYKAFWAWQDDKQEAWLREMAMQGYHLETTCFPGFYQFSEGQPRNDYYRLDYIDGPVRDLKEYLSQFEASGWEFVGKMNGWQYFRKTAGKDEVPKIADSNSAKAARYQKLVMVLVGSIPLLLIFPPILGRNISQPLFEILKILYFLFLAFDAFATYKIYQRIMQLRES